MGKVVEWIKRVREIWMGVKFKMSVQRSSKNVSEHLDIQVCYL